MKSTLAEALLLALTGAVLAFAANWLSPRGLDLRRDFFFQAAPPATNATAQTSATAPARGTNQLSHFEQLAATLAAEGLRLGDGNQVTRLFHDPRCEQDLVAFIDTRSETEYEAAHIPGAYPFDYFYPQNYVSNILQVCQAAQEVVLYCNGGECELSQLAARLLCQWGVPKEKLLIYGGGITEWTNSHLPFETGPRKSCNIRRY